MNCGDDECEKYAVAIREGTPALVIIVTDIITRLMTDPVSFPNLVTTTGGPKDKRITRPCDPLNSSTHSKFRFTAYSELTKKLGYSGGAPVPFPEVCEVFVKAVFPGKVDEVYTNFHAGDKRRGDFDGTGSVGESDVSQE